MQYILSRRQHTQPECTAVQANLLANHVQTVALAAAAAAALRFALGGIGRPSKVRRAAGAPAPSPSPRTREILNGVAPKRGPGMLWRLTAGAAAAELGFQALQSSR